MENRRISLITKVRISTELSGYPPISVLPALSTINEKLVMKQLSLLET